LDDDLWAQIGWEQREVVGGSGVNGGYLNHTVDGRIAFGPYRGVYPFNSKITDALDQQEKIFGHARRAALAWFPMLKDVAFTHAWGGVFGVPRDHMPVMAYNPRTGIATGRGYSGEGVATANLSGRVLADLITEAPSPLSELPMTRHRPRSWEPEPIRWTGVTLVRRGQQKLLEEVARTGQYPDKPTLAQRLWDS
jgi:glycine/D-amino acid oxidase-like deaminating enzyme